MASDPENIGKWVDYGGDIWKIVGVNYLGDYDLERYEIREDCHYKIVSSCKLGLANDHPHFAFIVDMADMAAEIGQLRRAISKTGAPNGQ